MQLSQIQGHSGIVGCTFFFFFFFFDGAAIHPCMPTVAATELSCVCDVNTRMSDGQILNATLSDAQVHNILR